MTEPHQYAINITLTATEDGGMDVRIVSEPINSDESNPPPVEFMCASVTMREIITSAITQAKAGTPTNHIH